MNRVLESIQLCLLILRARPVSDSQYFTGNARSRFSSAVGLIRAICWWWRTRPRQRWRGGTP